MRSRETGPDRYSREPVLTDRFPPLLFLDGKQGGRYNEIYVIGYSGDNYALLTQKRSSLMIKSMTGYGRAEVSDENYRVTVEMKSVNNR